MTGAWAQGSGAETPETPSASPMPLVALLPREQSDPTLHFFAVSVVVALDVPPRVSVKPAAGSAGKVEIVSAQETERIAPSSRRVVFEAEAERSAQAWNVVVVVEVGASLLALEGPSVPALA
ncbi:MAG: hypothetical protein Q8O67_00850 [Deltaproteobacteria bacterium]|nr:hypothetical protein [Deltaproteobacteria bacterium]